MTCKGDVALKNFNKCAERKDELYGELKNTIKRLKARSLLEQADTKTHEYHDKSDRLNIERLLGESLGVDECYINLAIVEQSGYDVGNPGEEGVSASSFSILARQKIEVTGMTIAG